LDFALCKGLVNNPLSLSFAKLFLEAKDIFFSLWIFFYVIHQIQTINFKDLKNFK
jgi:hypothetical protein